MVCIWYDMYRMCITYILLWFPLNDDVRIWQPIHNMKRSSYHVATSIRIDDSKMVQWSQWCLHIQQWSKWLPDNNYSSLFCLHCVEFPAWSSWSLCHLCSLSKLHTLLRLYIFFCNIFVWYRMLACSQGSTTNRQKPNRKTQRSTTTKRWRDKTDFLMLETHCSMFVLNHHCTRMIEMRGKF